MYLLLPLHHEVFGVTLAEAGLLLAANRLVRIAGYGFVARFYAERGPRAACLLAAVGSVISTAGYGLLSGVWALLIARLLWGLSFAAMNIATQALATAELEGSARRSGRMRSMVAAGPFLGLVIGSVVDQLAGPRAAFLVLGATAVVAFAFAVKLPREGEGRPERLDGPRFRMPSRLDTWSFIQGMTLDGLFVIGISVLAAAALPSYAALAAGAALALRYIAEIALGPVGGGPAQHFGPHRVLTLLSVSTAVGLAVIGLGALWIGALLVVCLRGLSSPFRARSLRLKIPDASACRPLQRLPPGAIWVRVPDRSWLGLLLPLVPHPALYGSAALLLAASAPPLPACVSGGQRARIEKLNQIRSRRATDEAAGNGREDRVGI